MWWQENWRLVVLVAAILVVAGASLYFSGMLMPWPRTPRLG